MTAIAQPVLPGPESATAAPPRQMFYAGFWRRFMAFSIDGIILIILFGGIIFASGVYGAGITSGTFTVGTSLGTKPLSDFAKPRVEVTPEGTVETTNATVGLMTIHAVAKRSPSSSSSVISSYPSPLGFAILIGVWLLYASLLEASRLQATLGKLAMFIRVADEQGNRVSLTRAIVRNLLKYVSLATMLIGFMMAGWTKKKQALHDMMARCTVKVAVA